MNKNKYRIKKDITLDYGHVYPCYKVQMRILGFLWVTVKEYVEEYPEQAGVHLSAKCDAQDLLDILESY